ncbi:MAG: hypothetical protein ACTSU0_05695, partial [Alphaproteobacteria bacterium]
SIFAGGRRNSSPVSSSVDVVLEPADVLNCYCASTIQKPIQCPVYGLAYAAATLRSAADMYELAGHIH